MPASICGAEAGEEGRPFLSALSPELAARIEVVKWDGQRELLGIGAGIAVVIAALTFFLSQKTPRKD